MSQKPIRSRLNSKLSGSPILPDKSLVNQTEISQKAHTPQKQENYNIQPLDQKRNSVNTAFSQGRDSVNYKGSQIDSSKTYAKIKSHFLTQNNAQYKVIISMPKIEYTLQSENFTFIKTLSIQDVQ